MINKRQLKRILTMILSLITFLYGIYILVMGEKEFGMLIIIFTQLIDMDASFKDKFYRKK
ncbi:hypothetical protein [Ilyobacter polytropus]|uniref:hypothetical protein n=1 Tax=Ilyobacter polytropus TaxID=167642 RepID=UPI00031D2C4F|nr:hypothetical protein [Ilyobacter polytropus]